MCLQCHCSRADEVEHLSWRPKSVTLTATRLHRLLQVGGTPGRRDPTSSLSSKRTNVGVRTKRQKDGSKADDIHHGVARPGFRQLSVGNISRQTLYVLAADGSERQLSARLSSHPNFN